MSGHAEHIFAVIASADATPVHSSSWRRAHLMHALHPDSTRLPERDTRALRDGLERDGSLIAAAQPYLDQLFQALDEPEALVCLSDARGMVLAQRTRRKVDPWRRGASQCLGTVYSEQAVGTDALGTCLVERRPVVIDGHEHFLSCLTALTGFGAPIFGPEGAIIGALGIIARHRENGASRNAFVLMAVSGFARRIGLELFAKAFPDTRLMLASHDPTHSSAVLAIDRDDRVVGATGAARRILALSEARLARGVGVRDLSASPVVEDLATEEDRVIAKAMARFGHNRSLVAKTLGISRSTLYRKLARTSSPRGPLGDC